MDIGVRFYRPSRAAYPVTRVNTGTVDGGFTAARCGRRTQPCSQGPGSGAVLVSTARPRCHKSPNTSPHTAVPRGLVRLYTLSGQVSPYKSPNTDQPGVRR